MKKLCILGAVILTAAQSASAGLIAIAVTGFEPNESGIPALVTFEGFPNGPAVVPVLGGTLTYDVNTIVQSTTNNNGAKPFPTSEGGDYLSVLAGGLATFDVSGDQFSFQWGSIDAYNTITFYLGADSMAFTGTQVVSSSPAVEANGNQGFNGSAYVTFTGQFDKVELTTASNSFEIDNVGGYQVPDGGTTLALLGLSLTGIGFARRKLATA